VLAETATKVSGSLVSYRKSITHSEDAFARARIELKLDHSTPVTAAAPTQEHVPPELQSVPADTR
jgi:hypothetical protein